MDNDHYNPKLTVKTSVLDRASREFWKNFSQPQRDLQSYIVIIIHNITLYRSYPNSGRRPAGNPVRIRTCTTRGCWCTTVDKCVGPPNTRPDRDTCCCPGSTGSRRDSRTRSRPPGSDTTSRTVKGAADTRSRLRRQRIGIRKTIALITCYNTSSNNDTTWRAALKNDDSAETVNDCFVSGRTRRDVPSPLLL